MSGGPESIVVTIGKARRKTTVVINPLDQVDVPGTGILQHPDKPFLDNLLKKRDHTGITISRPGIFFGQRRQTLDYRRRGEDTIVARKRGSTLHVGVAKTVHDGDGQSRIGFRAEGYRHSAEPTRGNWSMTNLYNSRYQRTGIVDPLTVQISIENSKRWEWSHDAVQEVVFAALAAATRGKPARLGIPNNNKKPRP